MPLWDEIDRSQPSEPPPDMWTGRATMRDGSQAPAYSAQDPLAPLIEKIGRPAAEKIAGVAGKINRTGQGLWQSLLDAEAERTGNVSSISTDYDPRNEAIRHATDLASTVTMAPSVTGGAPGVVLGAGAKIPRAARGEVAQGFAPNNEQANRLLYGGTHSPDVPSGNRMVRYSKDGTPELVDLTDKGAGGYHGFSALRTGLPVEEMSYKIKGAPDLKSNVWDIADLKKRNAEMLFGVSDPTAGGGKLTKVGNTVLEKPVNMEGGLTYSLLHADKPVPGIPDAQRIFANQKGPVTGIINEAREIAERGGDPIFTSMMMAKTAGDQSKQTVKTAYQVARQAEPNKDVVRMIDEAMAQKSKDIKGAPHEPYPGFGSKKLEQWLEDVGGPYRAAFVKALDTSPVKKGGIPDMGEVRFANTDKRLRSTPTGASGLFMGGINPALGSTGKSLNSTYPTAFLGNKGDVGGLQGNVPFHILAPDLWRGLMKSGPPETFANVPAYYIARGMPNNLGKTQKVTDEVVDKVSEFFRHNPKGWAVPGMAGGASMLAPALFGGDKAEARQ